VKQRYAIIGVDPGMRSGGAVGVVRTDSGLELRWKRIWTTERRQAAVQDHAVKWALLHPLPVYVQVEGPYAETTAELTSVPTPAVADGDRVGRLTAAQYRAMIARKSKRQRPHVVKLTGVYAVEQSAGSWRIECARRLLTWCRREPWVVWAPKVTGVRMPAKGEVVNAVLRRIADRTFPGWDEGLSKSAQSHVLDALGQVLFRDPFIAMGFPPDAKVKVR
jgi:hypothetical protein